MADLRQPLRIARWRFPLNMQPCLVMRAISFVAFLFLSLSALAEPEITSFIRVDEDASAARLQTAVTRYSKDGVTLDLVGAVHLADKAYYEKLNQRFGTYDALLFEMVGGGANAKPEPEPAPDPAAKDPAAGLQAIYAMVARMLRLESQSAVIDYSPAHFVHADLSIAEFKDLQEKRGESVLGFAMEAGKAAPAKSEPDMRRLMMAMLAGDSSSLKLQLIHSLGAGDDQIRAFAGESVIIGDRNAKVIEVLDSQLKKDRKNLGIFYGAAHFPDLEKRLATNGWKLTGQEWLTAWDVTKPKPTPADAAPAASDKPDPG